MFLKTPEFWYSPNTGRDLLAAALLTPASWLYDGLRRMHRKTRQGTIYAANIPVICVGNFIAGGAGKTPIAIALMDIIKSERLAQNPVFLTRGYGGSLRKPTCVRPSTHNAAQSGDEAQLLCRSAPVIVAANRPSGAQLAEENGADLILMDDGLQNPRLKKTLTLAVIDGRLGFGNGKLLPAGPLRLPVREGLDLTDAVILLNAPENKLNLHGKPIFEAAVTARTEKLDKTIPYIGFCGLAHPFKFRRSLEDAGVKLVAFHEFPDHHPYSPADLQKLENAARAAGARLVTTEKDAVKLSLCFRHNNALDIVKLDTQWQDREGLVRLLRHCIKKDN